MSATDDQVVKMVASDGSGEAVFSVDKAYRYSLRRTFPPGLFTKSPPLVMLVTMLNPSVADATDPDLTITKLLGFGERYGASTLWVLNMYGLVSTNPTGLFMADDPIGPLNDDFIRGVAEAAPTHGNVLSIVAWGSHSMATPERVAAVTEMLPRPLFCFGTTADGQPRHPSRLAYATPLVRWERRAA